MKYKLSRYLRHKGVSNGYHGVYNPLKNHGIIFLDSNNYKYFLEFQNPKEITKSKIKPKVLEKLVKDRFLLPTDYDPQTPIKSLRDKLPKDPDFSLMYLLLSSKCNLRCEYCFEVGNETPNQIRKNMSERTASNAIEFFSQVAKKDPKEGHSVIFYGGEPLINGKVFRYAVRKLRNYENEGRLKDLKMIINTNGSYVNKSMAEFCARYGINPAISIDGTKEIHDNVRKKRDNGSSFEDAKRAYELFKEQKVNPGISCTISSKNIINLEEIATFFADEFEPNGIGFNFLLDLTCGQNPLSIPIKESTEKLINVFEILRERGIYEERLMRRVGKFVNNQIHLKDCAGYGNQIVFGPDGSFGPCHIFLDAGKYIAGNVNDNPPDPRTHAIFKEWNNRTAFAMEGCEDCSEITLCGGGCAYNAYVTKGSIWEKDERMCEHCRILIDWIIDDVWKRKSDQNSIKS